MNRYWTTNEYVRRQRIRQRHADKRRKTRGRLARRRVRPTLKKLPVVDGRVLVTAPVTLSIFDEPRATIKFCSHIWRYLNERKGMVAVDLSAVIRVSSDALLLMRAVIDQAHGRGTAFSISGNLPSNRQVAAKMKQSGFFRGFSNPPRGLPEPLGVMHGKREKLVESDIAAEFVDFALAHATVDGGVASASYKTLVELMSNTHNHADGSAAHATLRGIDWSASVYCEDGVAHFAFVDLGVGILKSAGPREFLRRTKRTLLGHGHEALLRDVFSGLVGASLNVAGRGRGLPIMETYAKSGLLPELKILTDSVAGEVKDMEFYRIGTRLHGTMFRWRSSEMQRGEP